jgi:2-oxoglutarate dehydrogenase complex dehydrogenase (E1) component-like enzyme
MEVTTVAEDNSAQHYRQQFAAAIAVAACKVEKKEKEEMPAEMFQRITAAKVIKENKSIKSAAKMLVKKKKIQKISTYFHKK